MSPLFFFCLRLSLLFLSCSFIALATEHLRYIIHRRSFRLRAVAPQLPFIHCFQSGHQMLFTYDATRSVTGRTDLASFHSPFPPLLTFCLSSVYCLYLILGSYKYPFLVSPEPENRSPIFILLSLRLRVCVSCPSWLLFDRSITIRHAYHPPNSYTISAIVFTFPHLSITAPHRHTDLYKRKRG